jgi:hypothetical protein
LILIVPAQATVIDDVLDVVNYIRSVVVNINSEVTTIIQTLNGDMADVTAEFKEQVTLLRDRGELMKESAEQLLGFLNANKDEYLAFAGDSRCGNGSPCDLFKSELQTFVHDFSDLSDKFPIIQRLGLQDAPVLTAVIERMPPVLLFPLYQGMSRTADWQNIPTELASIYDEIGDPEAFAIPFGGGNQSGFTTASYSAASAADPTPTEKFCDSHRQKLDTQLDPIRLNRIQLSISALTTVLNMIGELQPVVAGGTLLGEGVVVPLPTVTNAIAFAIFWIQDAVGKYRENLSVCRDNRDAGRAAAKEIQLHLAQCLPLADYLYDSGYEKVRRQVERQIQRAADVGMPTIESDLSYQNAQRQKVQGYRTEAYRGLCDAYQKIGT